MAAYNEATRIGELWRNEEARELLLKYFPALNEAPHLLFMFKLSTVPQYIQFNRQVEGWPDDLEQRIMAELSAIAPVAEPIVDPVPEPFQEPVDTAEGTASAAYPNTAPKWDVFEVGLEGPSHGNPFVDVNVEAVFVQGNRSIRVPGFYDGAGRYLIRFMPDTEGKWTFAISSNARSMHGIAGEFQATPPREGSHGPVRVRNTYHFAYEDGTPYIPVGTTCYAWTHQGEELEQQTLRQLEASPFNKIRMCVFPKSYLFNLNEPPLAPFAGSLEDGWDYQTFNPEFFRHLEQRIAELGELNIEADLILFHPYDRWGFAEMDRASDDRYLRYLTARLAAYPNVWWSLANEFDLMWSKNEEDWDRFAAIIAEQDPYRHLISNHNCLAFYDFDKPWVTHCSVQRIDVYKTSEATGDWRKRWGKPVVIDECAYEGDIDQGWGNISGQEMVRRFWEGAIRGGYVGHGETYLNDEEILWWSKGGALVGDSPARIGFLRKLMEEGPSDGLEPLPSDWDVPRAGVEDAYYLYYFGFNQPRFREFRLRAGVQYKADIIDTWNMTIEELPGTYEGKFRLELPGRAFMAVRLTKHS